MHASCKSFIVSKRSSKFSRWSITYYWTARMTASAIHVTHPNHEILISNTGFPEVHTPHDQEHNRISPSTDCPQNPSISAAQFHIRLASIIAYQHAHVINPEDLALYPQTFAREVQHSYLSFITLPSNSRPEIWTDLVLFLFLQFKREALN
jgi:hypothetical protein